MKFGFFIGEICGFCRLTAGLGLAHVVFRKLSGTVSPSDECDQEVG